MCCRSSTLRTGTHAIFLTDLSRLSPLGLLLLLALRFEIQDTRGIFRALFVCRNVLCAGSEFLHSNYRTLLQALSFSPCLMAAD